MVPNTDRPPSGLHQERMTLMRQFKDTGRERERASQLGTARAHSVRRRNSLGHRSSSSLPLVYWFSWAGQRRSPCSIALFVHSSVAI